MYYNCIELVENKYFEDEKLLYHFFYKFVKNVSAHYFLFIFNYTYK